METYDQIQEHINAWVGGKDRSFRPVFDYFYPRLLAASLKMVKKKEDAEELAMNVLLRTWQHRQKIGEIDQFDGYLFGIMRQQIAGFVRKRVMLPESIGDIPLVKLGTVSHPELSLREIRQRYQAGLSRLPVQRRKIFLMSREEELSNKEIAERTGLSVHTVNNHIKSSLKVMKDEFRDNPEIAFVIAVTPAMLFLV